jgi:hypothetical protein
MNTVESTSCLPIQKVCRALGKEFHVCLGRVPTEMKPNDTPALLKSAVDMAQKHGWDGYNIDGAAPRSMVSPPYAELRTSTRLRRVGVRAAFLPDQLHEVDQPHLQSGRRVARRDPEATAADR